MSLINVAQLNINHHYVINTNVSSTTTYKYFVLNANEQAQKKIALYAENYLKQNCKLICLNSCDSEGTDKILN